MSDAFALAAGELHGWLVSGPGLSQGEHFISNNGEPTRRSLATFKENGCTIIPMKRLDVAADRAGRTTESATSEAAAFFQAHAAWLWGNWSTTPEGRAYKVEFDKHVAALSQAKGQP